MPGFCRPGQSINLSRQSKLVQDTSQEEHDERLKAVLCSCEQINLSLNKEKCHFKVLEVTYIGHILNDKSIQPDPEKVRISHHQLTKKGWKYYLP